MKQSPMSIVVGVGSLTRQDPALAAASALAEALAATIYVVHAFELPPVFGYSYRMRYTYPEALRRQRIEMQTKLEEQIGRLPGRAHIQHRVFEGPPAQILAAVAAKVQADLVVVGATQRGMLHRALLGTTTQRVMRAATVPVLVVRCPLHLPLRRVLLATDLSALSAQVQERARAVVEPLSAAPALRALLVLPFDVVFPALIRQEAVQSARRDLKAFLAKTQRGPRAVEGRVRVGEPAAEILAEAAEWNADLVVIGTHGRSAPHRFLLGSVAEATVRGATCNVLVIPVAGGSPAREASPGTGAPRRVPAPR